MSHLKYEKFQNVESTFIKEIPDSWRVKPLHTLCGFQQGKAHEPYVDLDGDFICVNARFISTEGRRVKHCTKNLTPAAPHDILMVMSDLPNGRALAKAYYVDDLENYAVNQRVCAVTALNVHPRFLFYQLNRSAYFLKYDDGSNQTHLSNDAFKKFPVLVPSEEEQQKIANFLDHETAKIDTLIEKQQQLIKLLKEKRQAVISHAVTKGLNPDAPMKDSGVEWLGEVPEGWGVAKVRYVARLESGHTPSRYRQDYWENCTIPWISLTDVWQMRAGNQKYISDTNEKISQRGLENSAARLLPAGTVILSRTASVGFSGIMAVEMATTQDFANWVCSEKIVSEYLLFCFWAMRSEFDRLMVGSTHKTIYMPDIKELVIAVPPVKEQEAIVNRLDSKLPCFDVLEEKLNQKTIILKERRTALISAAVTGKLDVRNWQPPKATSTPSTDA